MMKAVSVLFSSEFVKFVLAGATAAAANFFSRMLFGLIMPYSSSIVCAYAVGMLTAFILFKYLVFEQSTQSNRQQLGYFLLVNVIAILLILAVSLFLYHEVFRWIDDTFIREEVAHGIGICVSTLSSYLGHKLLTFKRVEL